MTGSCGRHLGLDRTQVAIGLAVLVAAALGLAACGRNGPLELPPGPAVGQAAPAPSPVPGESADSTMPHSARQTTAMRNGFDAQGNPVAPPGEKKQFILDPLLQ